MALNVKIEHAVNQLKRKTGLLTVNGSFITEAHLAALVGGAKRKWANVSMHASKLNEFNTGLDFIGGTCGGHAFAIGLGTKERRCEELTIRLSFSGASLRLRGWSFNLRGNYVYDRISGPGHRLDVSLTAFGDAPARSLPHGLVGQSFSSMGPRNGKRDWYPFSGSFTTSAMAEGAIEGHYA